MAKTRNLLGNDFDILSGDDDVTFAMMTRDDIKAQGVVSVMSNIVPGALAEMTAALTRGDIARGKELAEALDPLFKIVTVKTVEEYEGFQVPCKFRNPSAIKTLMGGLGMPAGPCRPPLGRMTPKATAVVREAIRTVYEKSAEVLTPIQDFYKIDLEERIYQDEHWV
jgi:4-hydroxy-tetrahydrodipicolinate synthase